MCEHRATGYSGGQRGWRIRVPAAQSRRRSSARGLLCLLCACGVLGLGGAVPERGVFWAREWVVSGRDGAAGDCVAMVQESWETCSNGAVLLLKMVVWGGVATWNEGFLSQRCLGCVGDLGVRGLDWDVSGWRGVKRIRVLVVGPGLDVRLFVVRVEAVGLPGGTLVWALLIGGDQKSFFLLTVATNSLR